mmetsp:Transcript_3380/g.4720  ORF Transcript_3380/g.4720 Transcript_3380/m.4720 type:complete len:113 (+) Transcript_3380:47-385(+)|eukprot:CAMPEP_0197290740 /NCGR_PEP_ID=MMETSP0890-20130614/9664_1 /TAXON_ID=44058 ORGANISM="Aureoumbra lagunensis, Strain CCMP1510" /NCGR_SAMPLE_ID=MMETSP0890 /ASSEMBLY_ACC=CAM_ASM_000533 /LENGTH=112 /DNA_ID=CAMNT_0042762981 /DNA_START=45 /DNA_END=383 /DNA_ORIENTATION=+
MIGAVRRSIVVSPVARTVIRSQRRYLGAHDPGYVIGGKQFSTPQVVLGIMGFYTCLGIFLTSGGKKKKEDKPAVSVTSSSSSSEVLSIFDEGFDEWSKIPENMDKWVASLSE